MNNFYFYQVLIIILQVLQTYSHGLAALKLSSKDSGLTIDNVDETMAELAEVIII